MPFSLSKPHIMKFHRISLVFLLLTVHPVFSGHLFLLTSCRSLALTLLPVVAPSVQLHQGFGIPFVTTRSCNTLNSFRHHLKKDYFQAAFNTPWRQTPAPLIHLWLMALYKCIYLLTYLFRTPNSPPGPLYCTYDDSVAFSWSKKL